MHLKNKRFCSAFFISFLILVLCVCPVWAKKNPASSGQQGQQGQTRDTALFGPTLTLKTGDQKRLFFFHADRLSSYYSSDPTIASISSEGTLVAEEPGYSSLIYNRNGRLCQCTVHVTDTEETETVSSSQTIPSLPNNALQTEEPLLFIEAGDSYQVRLSSASQSLCAKYGSPSWSSDSTSVAQVDRQGNITTKQSGTAVITGRLGNASCKIYVNVIKDTYDGNSSQFSVLTQTGKKRTYCLYKQNAHNYPKYDNYLAWHGCATCSLASVLGAYQKKYADILPSAVIDGPEKQFTSSNAWNREHVRRSLRRQMPLSLYGISSILKSCGVSNQYVRTYSETEAREDILSHLKTGNPIIFEVRQKSNKHRKNSQRWTNSYHTMILLGVLTNGKVLLSDSVDRSWYSGGQRLKIVELSDLMEYMFPCTTFSESMYYDGASSDGGYIKIQEPEN